jgi:hypothetical protein
MNKTMNEKKEIQAHKKEKTRQKIEEVFFSFFD